MRWTFRNVDTGMISQLHSDQWMRPNGSTVIIFCLRVKPGAAKPPIYPSTNLYGGPAEVDNHTHTNTHTQREREKCHCIAQSINMNKFMDQPPVSQIKTRAAEVRTYGAVHFACKIRRQDEQINCALRLFVCSRRASICVGTKRTMGEC